MVILYHNKGGKLMKEFNINKNNYEIFAVENGVKINVNHGEEEYLVDTFGTAYLFVLMLVECETDEDRKMVERTYFHEQYELEGLTEIEDYDDCDYEIGFNPYMGCYDYDC